jgi:two-component system KDP operon response regulator KdpE
MADPVTVLIVDDEVQIRRFLRAGFELEGFQVLDAETGAEGLRLATLKPSDLIILDLGLGDMDGAEVVERLRSWSSVPLIVLSVRSKEEEKVRLLELGPLMIDLAARSVRLSGKRLVLTPKEYRLLQVLAQHAGNVVTHQHLLREVWGATHVNDSHYLRIFIRKLRQKIEADPTRPRILITELGVGYRIGHEQELAGGPRN